MATVTGFTLYATIQYPVNHREEEPVLVPAKLEFSVEEMCILYLFLANNADDIDANRFDDLADKFAEYLRPMGLVR